MCCFKVHDAMCDAGSLSRCRSALTNRHWSSEGHEKVDKQQWQQQ